MEGPSGAEQMNADPGFVIPIDPIGEGKETSTP